MIELDDDMLRFVRVDYDPDIDSLKEFKAKARATNPVNIKETNEPKPAGKESHFFYYVYGYDNSLEQNPEYINPVDRVYGIKSLSDADKKELIINLKKVSRKTIKNFSFVTVARHLFLAVNSLIKNDSRFKTVQQAYSYAISGEKADFPKIEATEFMDIAELSVCYYDKRHEKPMSQNKVLSIRELKTIIGLCRNYNMPCKPTVFASMLLDIDNHDYGSHLMDDYKFDMTPINNTLFVSHGRNALLNEESPIISAYDMYNNMRLRSIVGQAKSAEEVYKTLEFQRFKGDEPSLLLNFGVDFCRWLALYEMFFGNSESEYAGIDSPQFYHIDESATSFYNKEIADTVDYIIKHNHVKASDFNLDNEIRDYIDNDMSTADWEWLRKSRSNDLKYKNLLIMFLIKKVKDYYNSEFDEAQVNKIAAIIYYYFYPINKAYDYICEKIKSDLKDPEAAKKYVFFAENLYVPDIIDTKKLSKIIQNMVENGDFSSYPKEFIEQKITTQYFSQE